MSRNGRQDAQARKRRREERDSGPTKTTLTKRQRQRGERLYVACGQSFLSQQARDRHFNNCPACNTDLKKK